MKLFIILFFLISFVSHANFSDFEGIVKLSNCSASLVKFEEQPYSSNAYVLTNGHCLENIFLMPGQLLADWDQEIKMKIFTKNKKLVSVTARKIAVATMTRTDLALFELYQTYDDILKVGISPFVISRNMVNIKDKIKIVSGYWENSYSCHVEKIVHKLIEGKWSFKNAIRYSKGCDVIAGTSGSPIIKSNSRILVGVNSTGNLNGQKCSFDNACEIDQNGEIFYKKGLRYGQQINMLYDCLNEDFKIDVLKRGCSLSI